MTETVHVRYAANSSIASLRRRITETVKEKRLLEIVKEFPNLFSIMQGGPARFEFHPQDWLVLNTIPSYWNYF